MTYLEEYFGHIPTQEEIDSFWKHDQQDYDGFCPSDVGIDGCIFDGSCQDCWNRKVNHDRTDTELFNAEMFVITSDGKRCGEGHTSLMLNKIESLLGDK